MTAEQLWQEISKLDKREADRLIETMVQCWEQWNPGYTLMLASLPKNDFAEQRRILEFGLRMVEMAEEESK